MPIGLKDIQYFCFLLICVAFVDTQGQRFDSLSNRPPFFDDSDFDRESVHFFGPPTDRFWRQFWDAFNYRGPLQENTFPSRTPQFAGPILRPVERPERPFFTDFSFEEPFAVPEYFLPRRETVTRARQEDGSDEYERYRNYFFRRYGMNFVD